MWTYVPTKTVRHVINATFPEYRKQKVAIDCNGSVTFHDLNWSGGSRTEYRSATLDGRSGNSMANYNAMAPWRNPAEGQTILIPPGCCIVSAGFFCGKPATAVIYINRVDMPQLLPDS